MKYSDNVHNMNDRITTPSPPDSTQYRSLQILDELANNDAMTQRDLSNRLGIALGLVNSYMKNLIAKGYITVKNIPPKRYAYYLTPKGFAEKTRLAYDLLSDYTRIYREAKNNYRQLFFELERSGVKRVVFAGADEVAEFAYITLQETGIEIAGVADENKIGESFFGRTIIPFSEIAALTYDAVVVTTCVRRDKVVSELLVNGINKASIRDIFAL